MMSAIIIFEESSFIFSFVSSGLKCSFIFSFVSSGLMTKSLEAGVHIWGGSRENQNVKRWMWILLQSNSDESSSSHIVYKRGKSLEAILYTL